MNLVPGGRGPRRLGGRTVHEQHERRWTRSRALAAGLSDDPWVHVEVMLSTRHGPDRVGAACEVLEHEYGLPQVLVGPEDRG